MLRRMRLHQLLNYPSEELSKLAKLPYQGVFDK